MTWIDWKRRRCYVEPAEGGGKARWLTPGVSGASFALSRAAREVLLGADPPVALTQRAKRILAEVREEHLSAVHPAGIVITRDGEDVRWWTWAGYRANATLAATLSHLTDSVQRFDDASLRMRGDLTLRDVEGRDGRRQPNASACPMWTSARWRASSSARRYLNGWRPPPSPLAWPTSTPPCGSLPSRTRFTVVDSSRSPNAAV